LLSKKRFKDVLQLILSSKVPSDDELQVQHFIDLNQDAFDLYGRIHQRYVRTPAGLAKIYQKYLNGVYGTCPRLHCDRQKMLPLGMTDKQRTSRVKVYCPRCEESYMPNRNLASRSGNINLDGSFFGSDLPHVFLKHYPTAVVVPPKVYHYQPKIFGFQVFGKRGSKYFKPANYTGGVRFTEDDPDAQAILQPSQLVKNFK